MEAESVGSRGGESVAKYVGYKISKVRWKPQPSSAIQPSKIFATGSWDDEVNRVAIWQYDPTAPSYPLSSATSATLIEPSCECEVVVNGDVMEMKFLDEERIVVGLSTGNVALLRYRPTHKSLSISREWDRLHYITTHSRPATAVATCGVTIATGGEDGRINIIHPENSTPLRTIDNADNATVTGLACTVQTELLSTSTSGQLKLWDLRSKSTAVSKPARILVISGTSQPLQCLDRCTNQPHLVAVGRGDGSVCLWDLRQDKQPVSILQGHSSDVWEIQFHRLHSNHLFTCSEDCSLWHWDASFSPPSRSIATTLPSSHTPHTSHITNTPSTQRQQPSSMHTTQQASSHQFQSSLSSSWLSGAVQQGKIDITNILPTNKLPVNSLDVESRHLVCSTDSEMLYLVPNLTFR